ncbi:MAG: hypothetical protein EKK71_16480 [Candidatus Competibacteraceae bacterium]|nr:MAG: hypothetical protein EKK71_16480 [Candidatus Competibacteraceae bacterium]
MAKVLLNVRIDPELRESLKRLAQEENRPLSNLVETVLKQYTLRIDLGPTDRLNAIFQGNAKR